jgi:hypothetical protein
VPDALPLLREPYYDFLVRAAFPEEAAAYDGLKARAAQSLAETDEARGRALEMLDGRGTKAHQYAELEDEYRVMVKTIRDRFQSAVKRLLEDCVGPREN